MDYDIQAIVTAVVVSIVGSSFVNALFKAGLNKVGNMVSKLVSEALSSNKISQEKAEYVVERFDTLSAKLENKFDDVVNSNTITTEAVNNFLDAVKKRNELFNKILETELSDIE